MRQCGVASGARMGFDDRCTGLEDTRRDMIFPVVQSLASRQAGCSDRVGWVADGVCVRSAPSLLRFPSHHKRRTCV